VHNFFGPAQFALNLTAPVENALAPLGDYHLLSVVASAAAHQVTAIHPYARIVARPAMGTLDTQFRISFTEIGGGV